MLKEEPNVEISSDVEFFDDTDICDDLMESSNDLAEINNVSHETSQELVSKLTTKSNIKNNKKSAIAAEIKSETENGEESIQCYYCSQVCKFCNNIVKNCNYCNMIYCKNMFVYILSTVCLHFSVIY